MKLRFAPSPTGFLHVGNARIALYNYLLALRFGGEFILRIDDTGSDAQEEYERCIEEDLRWIGIKWNLKVRQSERVDLYEAHFNSLVKRGLIYPCFCSKEDLERERKKALLQGRPPKYSGRCRNLARDEVERRLSSGEPCCWRFRVPAKKRIKVADEVKGEKVFYSDVFGDFVVRRSDGSFLFIFTCSVDDGDMGITHVIRGEDHLSNAPLQVVLMEAMGFEAPVFAHLPLLVDEGGKPFSKRNAPPSLRSLREEGFLPEAVVAALVNIGRKKPVEGCPCVDDLSKEFSLKDYGVSRAVMSKDLLLHHNRRCILTMDVDKLTERFVSFSGREEKAKEFVELFRENVSTLKELYYLYRKVVEGDYTFHPDEEQNLIIRAFLAADCDLNMVLSKLCLPKGKVFKTLRLALTGEKHGPPLDRVIDFLGKEEIVKRLGTFVS